MPKASLVPLSGDEKVERRRSERVRLLVRVDYQNIDEIFSDFARDINEGGMFIETERPPEVGSEIYLQFRIPGSDQPVSSVGRVVRISRGEADEPPGMGIEFDELDDRSRAQVNDLIRSLRS